MPKKLDHQELKNGILAFLNDFHASHDMYPTLREIAAGTGITLSTVHRLMKEMGDEGVVSSGGNRRRSITQEDMSLESPHRSIPVLGTVACGPGEEEEERLTEYIRMPESLVGSGELFGLIAKGESMIDAGVYPGDYVIVRRDKQAEVGDIVVALLGGMNNLKVLGFDHVLHRYVLKSCNTDHKRYPDIPVESELRIQGVAVSVSHRLGKVTT